jgi:ABC-type Na+ transport system ATPase subunit NatA
LADVESICDKFSIIHKWNIVVESMKIKDLKKPLEEFFIEKVSE